MKLQSFIACAILTRQTVPAAAAGSVRGGVAKNDIIQRDERPRQPRNDKNDGGDRNLREAHLPFRLFEQGLEPEFRARENRNSLRPNFNGNNTENEMDRDNRIIGGIQAQNCPWCVSMQDHIGHFCGGSMIAPNMVMTAAHCLGGSYDVVAGRRDLDKNTGQSVPMEKEIRHPGYNSQTTQSDFALLILEEAMDMNAGNVDLVELNFDRNVPEDAARVTVLGFGDTVQANDISKLSTKLLEVTVNMITNDECGRASGTIDGYSDNYFGQITSNMMCAKVDGGGKDACQGDSGGPLVIRNSQKTIQVGVVSWGIGCASEHFPGVYARISQVEGWIKKEVCKNGIDPPSYFGCDGGNSGGGGNSGSNNGSGASVSGFGSFDSGSGSGSNSGSGSGSGSGSNSGSGSGSSGSGSGSSNGNWDTVWDEGFDTGMGRFVDGGIDARHYDEAKFRNGVLRIQNKGTNRADAFTSGDDVSNYSTCQTVIDFMTIGFEAADKWCVEFSDNGKNYSNIKCYDIGNHNNKRWWDGERAEFSVKNIDKVYIRVRCISDNRKDDALIDRIKLECK